MTTNVDHVAFESTAGDAADHRRQLIIVVSGTDSPKIAGGLASEIETDFIGGAFIVENLEEGDDKAERLAHEALKLTLHTGIAILALPDTTIPLRRFRGAVPKDIDVRFILCGDNAREEKDAEGQDDRDNLKCLRVDVSEGKGGAEAVVRKIEAEVWGLDSRP